MLIYCAKCEAANTDKAPFCGECGHALMKTGRPVADRQPKERGPRWYEESSASSIRDAFNALGRLLTNLIMLIPQLLFALWGVALGGIGCISMIPAIREQELGGIAGGAYLVAALLVFLMLQLHDLGDKICRRLDALKIARQE